MIRIVVLLLLAARASAQERFQVYTTDNGLPNNAVLALLQAKDGYLWFTTYLGLVRFDGVHFQVFDSSNTPAIRGTTFATFGLMEDSHGAIWASCWNGGAIRYQDGVFSAFTIKDGLPNNRVVRIDEDAEGTIWILTSPGLSRIRNGKIEVVHFIDGEPIEPYLAPPPNVGKDPYLFGLWRFTRAGLQRFAYGKWSNVPLPKDVPHPTAVRIEAEDSQRRMWFTVGGRPGEAFFVQDGRVTVFNGLPSGAFADYQDKQGRLWITDRKGRTALWAAGRITPLDGISTPFPFRVVEDREGGVWVATLNQGLAHGIRQAITSIRLPGGPEANTTGPLFQDRAGDIWVGSFGLFRIKPGRSPLEAHRVLGWHAFERASALWADPDGTVFFGDVEGLKVFKNGRLREPERPLKEISSSPHVILRNRAGDLWLGGAGLFLYRNSKLTKFDASNSPLKGEVRALYEDKAGALWIGTDDLLCKHRNGVISCLEPSYSFSQWRVRSITGDADGVLWVATADKGILRMAGESLRWIQAKDGLYSNDAAAILEDNNGYLWISSRVGIYRVQKSELNAFAEGRIARVTSTSFDKRDGLNDTNNLGDGQPHAIAAQDGSFWFPTGDGVARVDPNTLVVNNSPPPIYIESCSLEQRKIPCRKDISLPPGARNLEIKYTALNLTKSDQIKFKYRLEALDKDWVDSGTRRTAYYPYLPAGKYRFYVTGSNSDGVWNPSPKELGITVRPRYYQSLWFQALAAGLMFGVFASAWRFRAAQFSKRQALQRAFAQEIIASQENERKRIAGELHDGLGQRLALIKNMALLLNQSNGQDHEERIEAIAAEASQAMSEVRQISHNLRPYQLDLLGLTKAVEVLITKTCEAAGTHADIVVDDLSGAFEKQAEIHFYRVVQECLSNIVKHSKATSISVLIQRTTASVSLVVSDNGVGFVPEAPNGNGKTGGFGLTGIAERARLLGGRAAIQSTPGQGTTVKIEINSGN